LTQTQNINSDIEAEAFQQPMFTIFFQQPTQQTDPLLANVKNQIQLDLRIP